MLHMGGIYTYLIKGTMKSKFKNFIAILNHTAIGQRPSCVVPKTKLILRVVRELVSRGYLQSFVEHEFSLDLYLRLTDGLPILRNIKFLGRSGYKISSVKCREFSNKLKSGSDFLFTVSSSNGLQWLSQLKREHRGGVLLLSVN